jgi:hypothetical protein
LVGEFGSESSEAVDQTVKLDRYASSVCPDEVFYFGVETGWLRWWCWDGHDYVEIIPNAEGRFWCNSVRLWFGLDGRQLRIYDLAGNPLGTYTEQVARVLQEARRADGAEAALGGGCFPEPLEFSQMLDRRPYPTYVTDAQWPILEALLPPEALRGRSPD